VVTEYPKSRGHLSRWASDWSVVGVEWWASSRVVGIESSGRHRVEWWASSRVVGIGVVSGYRRWSEVVGGRRWASEMVGGGRRWSEVVGGGGERIPLRIRDHLLSDGRTTYRRGW